MSQKRLDSFFTRSVSGRLYGRSLDDAEGLTAAATTVPDVSMEFGSTPASEFVSSPVTSLFLSCPSSPILQLGAMYDDVSPPCLHDDNDSVSSCNVCPSMTGTLSLAESSSTLPSPPTSLVQEPCSVSSADCASVDVSNIDDIGVLLRSMPQSSIISLPSSPLILTTFGLTKCCIDVY